MFFKLLPDDSSQLHEQSEGAKDHDFEDAPCVSSLSPLELQCCSAVEQRFKEVRLMPELSDEVPSF
jgi:hypothetical protein